MKRFFELLQLLVLVIFISCEPKPPDLRDYLDGWAYLTTFKILPAKSIEIENKRSKIKSGNNSVLVVELERRPILKTGASKSSDLHSYRYLMIELDLLDTLVTPSQVGNSKLYREIISLSPQFGVTKLNNNEKIEIKKLTSKRWKIISNLDDFKFEGIFNFSDSSIVTTTQTFMLDL